MGAHSRRARGFTLIEILVALIIVGLAMGALMRAFSLGLRNAEAARARTAATLFAESKLADLEAAGPIATGQSTGRFEERFRWRLRVRPYVEVDAAKETPAGSEDAALALYEVMVTVDWDGSGGQRSVSLTTLRLAPAE